MLKPGTVVKQSQTFINNKIEKDNPNRLSVVLFSENIDGKDYVCSCPITSTLGKKKQDYCHIPYLLLGPQRLGVIRIADLSLWSEDSVRSVDICIDVNNLQKIYNRVLEYDASNRQNVFEVAKRYISEIDLMEEAKEEHRRQISERKQFKKEKSKRKGKGGKIVRG